MTDKDTLHILDNDNEKSLEDIKPYDDETIDSLSEQENLDDKADNVYDENGLLILDNDDSYQMEPSLTESSALIDTDDEILSISVENLYKDDEKQSKFRSPLDLNRNPPDLVITSSTGEFVTFPLTKDVNTNIQRLTNEVNHAYVGMKKIKSNIPGTKPKKSIKTLLSDIAFKNRYLLAGVGVGGLLGVALNRNNMILTSIFAILSIVINIFAYKDYKERE